MTGRDRIARRYALALLEIADEDGQLDPVGAALDTLARLLVESAELRNVLLNPVFKNDGRPQILATLADRLELPTMVRNLVLMLSDRNRVILIESIAAAYRGLADERAGRVRAVVTTAYALAADERRRVEATLSRLAGGKELVLQVAVDPSLIAGMVARIGDTIYDGSLRTSLSSLRETLAGEA